MKARLILALVCSLGTMAASAVPAFAVEPVVVVATDKTELRPAASTRYLAWFVFDRRFSNANVWADRQTDGTESVIYTFAHRRDFSFSVAVDNADATTDVYFDRGSCRGPDFGDILTLPGV